MGVRRRVRPSLTAVSGAAVVVVFIGGNLLGFGADNPNAAAASAVCPWTSTTGLSANLTPKTRAEMVVSVMDTSEKATYAALNPKSSLVYENYIPAMPLLCLPSLRLEDGPAGVAFNATKVTQMPAPIDVAASWSPTVASDYGKTIGAEAAAKGVSVLQGPMLNIARVPEGGRNFEAFGEDPTLVSAMGDADIEGIQSQGVVAQAKHLAANNQETDRVHINEIINERTLQEIYLPAFKSAVDQAKVGSVMCAFNKINGVYACQSPALLTDILRIGWGFQGLVRSDLGAVHNAAQSIQAGDDLVKPLTANAIKTAVNDHKLPISALNTAVQDTLQMMFQYGLVTHPQPESPYADATSPAHRRTAQGIAEDGTVLLRNQPVGGKAVLPLARNKHNSIAVIGAGASSLPQLNGGGSSAVQPSHVTTPLQAIDGGAARHERITYAAGASYVYSPTTVSSPNLTVPDGSEPGLDETVSNGSTSHTIQTRRIDDSFGTAKSPSAPRGASPGHFSITWSGNLVASRTGRYVLGMSSTQGGTIDLNGHRISSSSRGNLPRKTVRLRADKPAKLSVSYTNTRPGGHVRLYWAPAEDPGSSLDAAVHAAAHAHTAIVVVHDVEAEGRDRPNLYLPADQDRLIEDVAQVNRRTVVVLDTGGPVLMPWLHSVASVVEAWYPGEMDGNALENVLTGRVDPSGKLPITFPASDSKTPVSQRSRWPGIHGVVHYSEGLEVGYRWYEAHHVKPLFPFGFGLSYTSFHMTTLHVTPSKQGGVTADVRVRNTGHRSGSTVVQAYLRYPHAAHEPPRQLRAFEKVTLKPHQRTTVSLRLPESAFEDWSDKNNRWQLTSGNYELYAGSSSADLPLHARVRSSGLS